MRALSRTTFVFVTALVVIYVFGFTMRNVLHLDCVGPVLPAWGCLAQPFPTTLSDAATTSEDTLRTLVAAALLFAVCYALRDVVVFGVVRLARRFFPGLLAPPASVRQAPRGYRHR